MAEALILLETEWAALIYFSVGGVALYDVFNYLGIGKCSQDTM